MFGIGGPGGIHKAWICNNLCFSLSVVLALFIHELLLLMCFSWPFFQGGGYGRTILHQPGFCDDFNFKILKTLAKFGERFSD
jgi:hypothetical protein